MFRVFDHAWYLITLGLRAKSDFQECLSRAPLRLPKHAKDIPMGKLTLAFLGLWIGVAPALAQDWPAKTVRIIVPFGPGSTPDMIGRLIADYLQQKLGQSFVIENRPGASANTGTDLVAKAEPDGYTIGVSLGGPLAINTLLFAKMPYDPAKDLALITMLTTQPSALVVNTSLGVNSVTELIEFLKKNPGTYNYGSIGNGSL